jgi:Ca-activated chloride channel family protein
MSKVVFLLAISVLFFTTLTFAQEQPEITAGTLLASGKRGKALGTCPLKKTSVRTDISGFVARVSVVQEFQNDFSEPIEAVYTFPLSQNSAVDNMTMTIGQRVIRGKIMKRVEARRVYEQAKDEGKTASLLDQERANIFTQSVANIRPGEKIIIEISYVETLKYDDGQYEFVFPMVVGRRYIPSSVDPADAQRITTGAIRPPGNDISIEVNLDAGVPIEAVRSISHEIETVNLAPGSAKITLKDAEAIPNKDFILRYDVTGKRIEDAVLAHRDEQGGFFTLMLQPPDQFVTDDRTPKEIVFVLDTSGSMGGFPIEKAKEAMNLSLGGLYPDDTFNLITFAGDTSVLFEAPVYATQANLERARAFLDSRQGGGGTEMMKAIRAALDPSDALDHLRIVCFMTDGYVGNENEIIAEIRKHPKARIFSFGIGDSVNRFLLDKMAQNGNGEVEYVTLTDNGSAAAKKFYERVRTPLLTDISVDWGGLEVADVYPQKIPDLFSAKPVVIQGRYLKPGAGSIRLRGRVAGQEYSREIAVNLPEAEAAHDVLAPLWARRRIDDLLDRSLVFNAEVGEEQYSLKKQSIDTITGLALEYRLMTQFTSFVAVEGRAAATSGKSRTVVTPVEDSSSTIAPEAEKSGLAASTSIGSGRTVKALYPLAVPDKSRVQGRGRGRGTGSGYGRGIGSGSGNGSGMSYAQAAAAPPPPVGISSMIFSPTPPTPVSVPKQISGGVLNGKAVSLPKPSFPAAASSVGVSGQVSVQVIVDENGRVISAVPVSGHALLKASAAEAAKRSTFSATKMSGQPVKVSGIITYNFQGAQDPQVAVGELSVAEASETSEITTEKAPEPPTPEMLAEAARIEREAKLRQMLAEKLHFWIFAAVERMRGGSAAPAVNEDRFVTGGKANIEIVFAARTPETIEKLKALGMQVTMIKGALRAEGIIPAEKLAELAIMEEVKLILPKMK